MKTVIRTAETHPLTWRLRDDKQPVWLLSLIHISEPTRRISLSRMPSSA